MDIDSYTHNLLEDRTLIVILHGSPIDVNDDKIISDLKNHDFTDKTVKRLGVNIKHIPTQETLKPKCRIPASQKKINTAVLVHHKIIKVIHRQVHIDTIINFMFYRHFY